MEAYSGSIYSYKRLLYIISGVITMVCLGTVYSYGVFRMPIEELFGIGATHSGMPYMTSLAFYAIFMGITGRFIDKYSPQSIVLFGGLLVSAGWILSFFAKDIYTLTLTYGVISGSGVGIAYGVPMSVVSKWFPDKKGLVVGLVLVGFGLSPILTAPVAKTLVDIYGVMNTFMILGISFLVIIPLMSFLFRNPPNEDVDSKLEEVEADEPGQVTASEMIKDSSFKGLYLNFIIATMIGLTVIGLTGTIAKDLFSLSADSATKFIPMFAIFNGLGRPLFGWIADKISVRLAMMISFCLILTASIILLATGGRSLYVYAISLSMFWMNLGGWLAIAPTSTWTLYGTKNYSKNYGVVFTAYGIGAIAGVFTSGMILDIFKSYNYLFMYIAALCLVGLYTSYSLIETEDKL
jgi:MFS transporter, OFA family, oxalate/formate antiporter